MRVPSASLCAVLSLLTVAMAGCFDPQGDGVFGPANSLGGEEGSSPALSLKATPARGPGPLEVGFSLSARDRDGDALGWTLEYGDRTPAAEGKSLPVTVKHTYTAPGAYVATFKVTDEEGESFSTLNIVVLEPIVTQSGTPSPTQGPSPPPPPPPPGGGGAPPPPPPPSNTTSNTTSASSSGSQTTSSTSTNTTAEPPPTSTSSSTSDSGTSSTTDTETFSDPGTSTSDTGTTSDSGTPSSDPTTSTSGSQTSTDPPL